MAINDPADEKSVLQESPSGAIPEPPLDDDVLFPEVGTQVTPPPAPSTGSTQTPLLGDEPHIDDTPQPGPQPPVGGLNLLLGLIEGGGGQASASAQARPAPPRPAPPPAAPETSSSARKRQAVPDPPEPDSGAHPEWSEMLPPEGPAAKALRDAESAPASGAVPKTLELRVHAMLEQLPALLTTAVDELETRNQQNLERQWARHRQTQEERLARMEVRMERLAEQVHLLKVRETDTGAIPADQVPGDMAKGRYMMPILVIGLLGLLAGIVMGTLLLRGGP